MKTRILTIVVVLLSLIPHQAQAVENGEDVKGNAFVVPIATDLGNGKGSGCSGTLIAQSIVVTAGHCVLDAEGLVTKNVYVGLAGSSQGSATVEDKIIDVKITSTFKNGPTNLVGEDDLAFLILGKSQPVRIPIVLASDKQAADFKSAGAVLKTMGYGNYANSGNDPATYPKSFTGTFLVQASARSNSDYMISTEGRVCTGDSGAPILNITATQVTLVGIVTGAAGLSTSNKCGQKNNDGKYWTLFTLVGRYADLAFAAANDVMNAQNETIAKQEIDIADLRIEAEASTNTSSDLIIQLGAANATIADLRKKLPQTIVCVKGKLKKTLAGINPKCPSGYKVKR